MQTHSKEYLDYMKSDKWQAKKTERLIIDDYKCVMCGRPASRCRKGLQTHHITYNSLGDENAMTDLVTLCGSCHKKLHNYLKRRRM